MKIKTRFLDEDNVTIRKGIYENGQTLLELVDGNGEVLMRPTVALMFPVNDGEVFIKNYSENEGILEALTDAGVIEPTGETVPCGYTEAHVAKLL